jgi:type I restriction enzyme S subunit
MAAVDLAYSQTVPSATERASLPPGWTWTTLGEVTLSVEKVDPSATPDRQITYLDISSIDNVTNQITEPKTYSGANAPSRARQLVSAGDVLFSTVRTYLKNIAQVPEAYDGQIASTGFSVLRSAPCVSPKYLFYYTLTESFLTPLAARQRGTSYPAVRDADVREQPFPLAPLPEQHRIVEAIETHFTRLDAGVAALRRVQANLRRYRAAVLKAACEGKLVPTEAELARSEGRDYEPAAVLLERILTERRAKWVQENPKKKYVEPAGPDVSGLPDLPEGWCWATIKAVGKVQLGRQRAPQHHQGAHMRPYLRVANVFEDRIDTGDVLEMNFTPSEYETYRLHYGDILLNEGQSPEYLGRPAMFRNEIPDACFQNTLIRFQAYESLDRCFALILFRHYLHKGRFRNESQITTNIAHLSAGRFAEIEFPLPPFSEQRRIVDEVERHLSVVNGMAAAVETNLARYRRLRQSILQQAFAGKLML